jgi:hypothetical protein
MLEQTIHSDTHTKQAHIHSRLGSVRYHCNRVDEPCDKVREESIAPLQKNQRNRQMQHHRHEVRHHWMSQSTAMDRHHQNRYLQRKFDNLRAL